MIKSIIALSILTLAILSYTANTMKSAATEYQTRQAGTISHIINGGK